MNIVEIIRSACADKLDRIAIVQEETRITYRQLFDRIDLLANKLTTLGVQRGRRVIFHSPDSIDYVVGALAILQAGGAVVPVPDSLTAAEIQDIITRMDGMGVLRQREKKAEDIGLPHEPVDEVFYWHARIASGELDDRCARLDAAFIRFSSGTTGQSKGVLLSHTSIAQRLSAANDGLKVTQEDVILWVLGMSHHFVVSILLFLRQGATIVIGHRQFPFSIIQAVNAHAVTLIYGSPVHLYLLAASDAVKAEALQQVRLAVSTAMKLPAPIARQFEGKFGFPPAQAYGIIEIGLPFVNPWTDDDSLGKPLPAYALQIEQPDGQGVGQVLIRGQGMFDAYVFPWKTRDEVLKEGWFDTGDLGRLDDAGRLRLLGRSKSVIVCAGMKIFPEEVEEVIGLHPGVLASLVEGKAHEQFGQVPVARVQIKPGVSQPQEVINQLRAHCMHRLTSYKVPVSFEMVDHLPRTPSGKLMRTPARTP